MSPTTSSSLATLAAAQDTLVTRKLNAPCSLNVPATRYWQPTLEPAYRTSGWEVCQPPLKHMDNSMLCLAERGFNGYEYWHQARATGAPLLWRRANNRRLPVKAVLADGSFLSEIHPPRRSNTTPNNIPSQEAGELALVTVRVIEYAMPGLPDAEPRYRLLTTLLDAQAAPALDLVAQGPFASCRAHGRSH